MDTARPAPAPAPAPLATGDAVRGARSGADGVVAYRTPAGIAVWIPALGRLVVAPDAAWSRR